MPRQNRDARAATGGTDVALTDGMFIGQNNLWDTMDRISTQEADRIVKRFERRRRVRNVVMGGALATLLVGGTAWTVTSETSQGWLQGVSAGIDQSSSVLTGASPGAARLAGDIERPADGGLQAAPTGSPSAELAQEAPAGLPLAEAPDPTPARPELVFVTAPDAQPAPPTGQASETRTAAASSRARADRGRPRVDPVAREATLDLPAGESPATETLAFDESAASDEITLEADDDEVPLGDVPATDDLTPDLAADTE